MIKQKFLHSLLPLLLSSAAFGQAYTHAPVFGNMGVIDHDMGPVAPNADKVAHAVQADGMVLLAGYSYNSNTGNYAMTMVRMDPVCGELDPTFADDGKLVHTFEWRTLCRSIVLQNDGKIVGAGLIASSNSWSHQYPGVFRFNSDGTIDSTFNGTGYHMAPLVVNDAGSFHEVFIDGEGRLLAAVVGAYHVGVMRFLPTGELDTDYGTNGSSMIPLGSYIHYTHGTAQMTEDGSMIVAGTAWPQGVPEHLFLARFDPSGAPASDFGADGLVWSTGHNADYSIVGAKGMDMVILSDGRIVVSYGLFEEQSRPTAAAFHTDGNPDTSFGTGGVFSYTGSSARAGGLHLLPDDRMLMFFGHDALSTAALLMIDPNGQLVETFGNNGILSGALVPGADYRAFHNGTMLADGSILAYGVRGGHGSTIMRFTLDAMQDALPAISLMNDGLETTGGGTFQWYLNGAPIEGATGQHLVPEQNGEYTVSMTHGTLCNYTSEPYMMLTVGIVEPPASTPMIMNSLVEGYLRVLNPGEPIEWTLYTSTGARYGSGILSSGENILDMSHLAPGVHLFNCPGGSGNMVHKIVKE